MSNVYCAQISSETEAAHHGPLKGKVDMLMWIFCSCIVVLLSKSVLEAFSSSMVLKLSYVLIARLFEFPPYLLQG